jgi:hypothetical protein
MRLYPVGQSCRAKGTPKMTREQAIRELIDVELDNVSGGSVMWGAAVEPMPVP